MNAAPQEHSWLALGAASRFLGVDPSTLRGWTDAGRIRAFRTPGGHRRYAVADLRAFVLRGRRVREGRLTDLLGPHGAVLVGGTPRRAVRAQEWYAAFDARTAEAMRHTCRRLMDGLAGYLAGGRRQGAYLHEGERAGRGLGTHVAAIGMTPAAATRAFLFFRKMVTDSVATKLPLSPDRKVQSIRRVDVYLNQVLVQMMDAYQERQPRGRHAS